MESYLLKPNRIEFRGRQERGGEGGRGGTGAMRRTVHINKVRLTDVKKALFKKFIYVKGRLAWKLQFLLRPRCDACSPLTWCCWFSGNSSLLSSCGTSSPGRTISPAPGRRVRNEHTCHSHVLQHYFKLRQNEANLV